eukprot:7674766-Ditylum_brightwellii.AAC.1
MNTSGTLVLLVDALTFLQVPKFTMLNQHSRMIIAIAVAEKMIIYGLDMSNAFQTNIEEKPYER